LLLIPLRIKKWEEENLLFEKNYRYMATRKTVGIVIGSTRPQRLCPEIAAWVRNIVQPNSPLTYALIDLAQINLPFLDEPLMPALGQYQHEHTQAWSRLVKSYAGFVFVLPQYNWGYPAPLKNALDFLYTEWADKPAGLVTYGSHGGGKAADGLKVVLQGLHMHTTATNPALSLTPQMLGADGQFQNIAADLQAYVPDLHALNAELVQFLE
jgi:NAD(P)H-dependent FMN reductase